MFEFLFQGFGVLILLILGYVFGRIAERRHLKRLIKREKESNALPAIASRHPPDDERYDLVLVTGNVVIASDYFKSFMAGMINLFGGRVTPFESMLDRARREAVLRMKDKAKTNNARYVFNVKFETTRVLVGQRGAMEVMAYGTALIPAPSTSY